MPTMFIALGPELHRKWRTKLGMDGLSGQSKIIEMIEEYVKDLNIKNKGNSDAKSSAQG